MPTTRRRHLVTETDEIAAAIDRATPRFPDSSRAEVLRQLVLAGATHLDERDDRRAALVRTIAGRHRGLYHPGTLEQLREEWPE